MRSFALAALWACAAAGCGSTEPPRSREAEKGPASTARERQREATLVLDKLAGALRSDRAERLSEVADPKHGITFWGQPGACLTPLFQIRPDDTGFLSQLAGKRIADAPPHYTDPNGYWREVAEAIRAGLRVVALDAGDYVVPPEEDLERAPPWGSLDTHDVALGKREYACLGERPREATRAPSSEYRFRYRAERGYASVTVFLVEHAGELKVAHVLLVWHYDA